MTDDTAAHHVARPPLRVALLLDSRIQPKWVWNVVRDIVESDVATVALLVVNAGGGDHAVTARPRIIGRAGRWVQNRDHLPLALYDRIDRWKFGTLLPDPFEAADITSLVEACPAVEVAPRMTQFSDYFDDAAVDEILSHDIDVALRFGFRILRGRALQIARHGVWSYHHGDNTVNRGGPAGYWEVFEGQPVTGAMLQVLTEDLDGGRVLARTFASTASISVTQNRANYFWQTSPMVIRKLRDLYHDGTAALGEEALNPPGWAAYSNPLYVAPRARQMWPVMARLAGRYVRAKMRSLRYHDQWFLAYKVAKRAAGGDAHADGSWAGDVPDGTPFRFKTLYPPPDRFWADPFPVCADGRRYVFFEELFYSNWRGRICVLELDERGNPGPATPVLERPYHMSYPFVFRHDGEWYMMPETMTQNAVELYRATRFPDAWEFDRTLVTLPLPADATIARIGDRWWMFVATRVPEVREWAELTLFHAESPLGPWTAHPRNPVKTDVRSARPAGRIFEHQGAYYRPAQDGSPHYGSATVVNRIDRLDVTGYAETMVARIDPRWMPGLTGTHTLNAAGGVTFIDARRLVRG